MTRQDSRDFRADAVHRIIRTAGFNGRFVIGRRTKSGAEMAAKGGRGLGANIPFSKETGCHISRRHFSRAPQISPAVVNVAISSP